MRERESNADYF
jgi:hypothetical protein